MKIYFIKPVKEIKELVLNNVFDPDEKLLEENQLLSVLETLIENDMVKF